MSQMIVRYAFQGKTGWGRLVSPAPERPEDEVELVELVTAATTTNALIGALEGESPVATGVSRRIPGTSLLSPITSDATLLCQGLNYSDHAQEAGHATRKQNLLFGKASSSLCGPYDDILRPNGVELLDFEVEVGIVLRSDLAAGQTITAELLGAHIAGVVLCNDVSARDVMFGAGYLQWFQGKSYRTFCPTGPVLYLIDPDEVPATLESLELSLEWNGDTRQKARTSQMIHRPAETLTEISRIMDLKRGDLVLTGTPGGVLARATPAVVEILRTHLLDDAGRRSELVRELKSNGGFLEPGDVVTLRLHDLLMQRSLGSQRNRIGQAADAMQ